MHVLDADGPAVRLAQRLEQVAQGDAAKAEERGGIDGAIEVGVGEAELGELEEGMRGAPLAEGVEVGEEMADVPVAMSGQASGTQSTTRQLGSALGIAVLGTVLFTTVSTRLDTALADLGAGRVDYVQESYLTIEPFLMTDAGKDFEKKADVPDDPIMGEGVGAAVRKDDQAMLGKLNAAIKAVWQDGTYKKLEEKYGLTGKLKEPTDLSPSN